LSFLSIEAAHTLSLTSPPASGRRLSRYERVAFPDGGLVCEPTTRESDMQIKSWVRRGAAAAVLVGVVGGCRYARFGPGVWDRLAQCESSGNWAINSGNGFYGGLQFLQATWDGFGGGAFAPRADLASRVQQIIVAERVLAKQGWNAWPECSRKLGLR
jgi:Transglycosylase-like domain